MSFRKVMDVLFPEASKIVEFKITSTPAHEDSHEKKDNGAQHQDKKLFGKQTKSASATKPDFYDMTFKLQA